MLQRNINFPQNINSCFTMFIDMTSPNPNQTSHTTAVLPKEYHDNPIVTLYYIHFMLSPTDLPEIGATPAYTKTQLQHWHSAYQSAISGATKDIY